MDRGVSSPIELSRIARGTGRRRCATAFALALLAFVLNAVPAVADRTSSLEYRVKSTGKVTVYRLDGVFLQKSEDLLRLTELVGTKDLMVLAPAVSSQLASLIVDRTSYRQHIAFVPACGFVASLVFEFRAPDAEPVWWIVTNCGKAALVDASIASSQWDNRAHYLTPSVLARLERCQDTWIWDRQPSCLGE